MQTPASRDRQLLALIADLGRASRGLHQGEIFCRGVTFTQFYILDLVAQAGRMPLGSLHDALAVDKSTTSRLVAPLLERGLVEREACCADSRARELAVTRKGRRVLGEVWHCLAPVLDSLRQALPSDQGEDVLATVRSFLEVLRRVCRPGCC